MPTISVNGTTIAYSDTGTPDGRPDAPAIVFGHGLLFSGWVFHPQIAVLRDQYRCVTIDWRGQGDTPASADGYDMDTLTGDALALIRELDLAPVHWVGLSMGGFVGLRIAARHGELVRSLTLLDTSAEPENPGKSGEYRLLASVQRLIGIKPLLGKVKPAMFGPAFLADPRSKPLIDEWVSQLSRNNRAGTRKAVLAVVDRKPVDDEIAKIKAPTLVVVGADDVSTPPEKAERIAGLVPAARLEIVPECGHTSPLEQPETITELLVTFLKG
jgi:pimeloyl-ACP methyl ester carboxylesterase